MIRAVALALVCLAGLCVIAAAAKKPTLPQPPEIVFPEVAGVKADRLELIISEVAPTDAEKVVDVVYAPPAAEGTLSSRQKATSQSSIRLASRHWHDPHNPKFEKTKQKAKSSKPSQTNSADRALNQVNSAKECRSDGVVPLLRKLNLSPPCG